MKETLSMLWKRTKNAVKQNNSLKSVLFILFCILIGGIVMTIGVAIFEPTYVYPSIRIFIVTYLAGGILFTMGLAGVAMIILLLTMIKEEPTILFSSNMIIGYIVLLLAILLL